MATQNRNPDDQDQRSGGYGGSTGGARPKQDDRAGTGAGGRETPVTSPLDADEALGNRTGGYGGNPASDDQADGSAER